ncbi:hypothetical protein BLA23254_00030 [Burkholderia lata]|uniref:Uncharacterized protein n=1 Tax=Burkholderia lata (strain ATCC 17760 / DSM 23089 / LMG 22485 / NCIMB 9086 / R18194 / 383) TaxID=482957 RepID=A0A6P2GMZ6_BURL3|nr:hypothetical protein BLA23254_00030 [Burkholderia lata]
MQVWRRKRQRPATHPMPGWQAPQDARVMRQARAAPPTHRTMHAPTKRDVPEKLPMQATRLMRMT